MPSATLKTWLLSWDLWEAEQPAWFMDSQNILGYDFESRIVTYAPIEAFPRCLLLKILQGSQNHGANKHGKVMPLLPLRTCLRRILNKLSIQTHTQQEIEPSGVCTEELIAMLQRRRAAFGMTSKVVPSGSGDDPERPDVSAGGAGASVSESAGDNKGRGEGP